MSWSLYWVFIIIHSLLVKWENWSKTNLCCLLYYVTGIQMTLNWNAVGFKPLWLMSNTKHLDLQIGFICRKAKIILAQMMISILSTLQNEALLQGSVLWEVMSQSKPNRNRKVELSHDALKGSIFIRLTITDFKCRFLASHIGKVIVSKNRLQR